MSNELSTSYNTKRVVVLVDMDCFYCQVEVQHNQSLTGKPVAVVQYNSWRGGGIIAVNYEARAKGVNRHMRGDDAIQTCPDLNLVRVKELHGKADLSRYRTASQQVFEVLSDFSSCVQRASIDEAYIDLTSLVDNHISSNQKVITEKDLPNTFVEGYSDQNSKEENSESIKSWLHDVYNNELQEDNLLRLTVGAMMVEKLRESVYKKTGYRCSAGISNNKILAKLACGLHKPNQQTLLPSSSVPRLFETIPIKKVKNLGGKLGNRVKDEFNCKFMSDLAAIPLCDLQKKFDTKTSNFLYQISKGIDNETVESRLIPKSIGSCKSFPLGLKQKEEVKHWLSTLMNDIFEKIEVDYETNKRKATLMTVSVRYSDKKINLPTSQCGEVTTYNINKLLDAAFLMLCTMTENQKSSNWKNALSYLGVAIGKFKEVKVKSSIDNYFNKGISKEEHDINSQPVNSPSCSYSNSHIIPCNQQLLLDLKNIATPANQPSKPLNHSNLKKNNISNSDVKNIKNMFSLMQDVCHSTITANGLDTKEVKENIKQNKNNLNSFFSKKLEIISPVKNQDNDKPPSSVPFSSVSFFSKKLEKISPSKSSQNEHITSSLNNFSLKKLEMPSCSKDQTKSDVESIPTVQFSIADEGNDEDLTMLLCERCNTKIDINQYDEHIDFHVATELSNSLNASEILRPINDEKHTNGPIKKINNKSGKKRKQNSSASISNPKKSCSSISSYFKPILDP